MSISRGEIYLCSLSPVIGKEISKTRPVVIVSNNVNNKFSGTVTVLPITSQKVEKIYPFEVLLDAGKGNLSKMSKVKTDQIRTVDSRRLISLIGELEDEDMVRIDRALKIHFAIY